VSKSLWCRLPPARRAAFTETGERASQGRLALLSFAQQQQEGQPCSQPM
jgi:hypothetical protein